MSDNWRGIAEVEGVARTSSTFDRNLVVFSNSDWNANCEVGLIHGKHIEIFSANVSLVITQSSSQLVTIKLCALKIILSTK